MSSMFLPRIYLGTVAWDSYVARTASVRLELRQCAELQVEIDCFQHSENERKI